MNSDNKYTKMQNSFYENEANKWSLSQRDHVVGSFNDHNNHKDYDLLFSNIETKDKIALDFGCGPGRNIVKFRNLFGRIDGVDIAQKNLDNAKTWLSHNGINFDDLNLYKCDGTNLSVIESNQYDVVFSTICLQHICVYQIRLNYFKEFYRVLNSGGWLTVQMGYGENSPQTVDYYTDFINAEGTNRACDTRITSINQPKKDLESMGFINFDSQIRPVGPGDIHPNWIFFRAQKP